MRNQRPKKSKKHKENEANVQAGMIFVSLKALAGEGTVGASLLKS